MCGQNREWIYAYADGELEAEQAIAMEAHLAECEVCRAEYEWILRLKGNFVSMGDRPVPTQVGVAWRRQLEQRAAKGRKQGLRRWVSVAGFMAVSLCLVLWSTQFPFSQETDGIDDDHGAQQSPVVSQGIVSQETTENSTEVLEEQQRELSQEEILPDQMMGVLSITQDEAIQMGDSLGVSWKEAVNGGIYIPFEDREQVRKLLSKFGYTLPENERNPMRICFFLDSGEMGWFLEEGDTIPDMILSVSEKEVAYLADRLQCSFYETEMGFFIPREYRQSAKILLEGLGHVVPDDLRYLRIMWG